MEKKRKKICVVTATRAEFGLLLNVIQRIRKDPELELCLAVTGTHLSDAYGMTVREIEESGVPIAERIPILTDGTAAGAVGASVRGETVAGGAGASVPGSEDAGALAVCQAMGQASARFGELYARQRPDLLVVLGDRYELIPICAAALQFQIPIAHISGGEVTRGALDDSYRHCITKMSHLHFPGCAAYRQRIIQLGEDPRRVFDYGDVGVENIVTMNVMSKEELEESIGFSLGESYACVTFHPPTAEAAGRATTAAGARATTAAVRESAAVTQIRAVLDALEAFPEMRFLITKANADAGGREINAVIDAYTARHENWICFFSLGVRRYVSALNYCDMVIGNSSSGIVEAPCFHIPTVNIGSRQDGRLMAESILSCAPKTQDIIAAMRRAMSPEFAEIVKRARNPYGGGDTSRRIVEEIKRFLERPEFQKIFYDLDGRETCCDIWQ